MPDKSVTSEAMRAAREPQGGFSEIKPAGEKIINDPRLNEWLAKGQAKQESDGLWLHYAVVCTLLKKETK